MTRALILSAPRSGSGKTVITAGILRALHRQGYDVAGAKFGPDYIDPKFHEAATRKESVNLDPWAMAPARLRALVQGSNLRIIEGAMGLFDGATEMNAASTADLAEQLGAPIVLIVDCSGQSGSVGALVHGFLSYRSHIHVAGVILNNVGSARHNAMLRNALGSTPVFGVLPRDKAFHLPSRHLGLVQAEETDALDTRLEEIADVIERNCDLSHLQNCAKVVPNAKGQRLAPPAQRIAIAQDAAFRFSYPHMLSDWRAAGAELLPFSPLNDDPVPDADFVFLPGGYPELHAGRIAAATTFINSLKNATQSADIYGECGGYMVLGQHLIDADGTAHEMAGLLQLVTSFEKRKLHLGYRKLTGQHGWLAGNWAAHEFHYASTISAKGEPLFSAQNADGVALDPMGLIDGRVSGSFAHLIDRHSLA